MWWFDSSPEESSRFPSSSSHCWAEISHCLQWSNGRELLECFHLHLYLWLWFQQINFDQPSHRDKHASCPKVHQDKFFRVWTDRSRFEPEYSVFSPRNFSSNHSKNYLKPKNLYWIEAACTWHHPFLIW